MDELASWQFFTPEERARDLAAAIRASAQLSREGAKARRKAHISHMNKTVRAARAAGLQVARVDLCADGAVSLYVGEPEAAPEEQGGRSRLDDLLGT